MSRVLLNIVSHAYCVIRADFIGSRSAPTYGNIPPSFPLTGTTASIRMADQNMGFRYMPADAKKLACVRARLRRHPLM